VKVNAMTSSKLVFDPTHGSSFADRTMVVSGGSPSRIRSFRVPCTPPRQILSRYGGGPDPIMDIFVDK
jgi:hypothetical protein